MFAGRSNPLHSSGSDCLHIVLKYQMKRLGSTQTFTSDLTICILIVILFEQTKFFLCRFIGQAKFPCEEKLNSIEWLHIWHCDLTNLLGSGFQIWTFDAPTKSARKTWGQHKKLVKDWGLFWVTERSGSSWRLCRYDGTSYSFHIGSYTSSSILSASMYKEHLESDRLCFWFLDNCLNWLPFMGVGDTLVL